MTTHWFPFIRPAIKPLSKCGGYVRGRGWLTGHKFKFIGRSFEALSMRFPPFLFFGEDWKLLTKLQGTLFEDHYLWCRPLVAWLLSVRIPSFEPLGEAFQGMAMNAPPSWKTLSNISLGFFQTMCVYMGVSKNRGKTPQIIHFKK